MTADHGTPLPGLEPHEHGRHGFAATALTALRRAGPRLYGVSARVTASAALGGLLVTAVGFLVAWPTFTEIREGAVRAHLDEDSYAPDGSRVHTLWVILLVCLPVLIALLHAGCAAVQTACARATAERGEGGPRGGVRTVLGTYALRGALVWTPLVVGVLVQEYFTTTTFREYTAIVPKWEYPNLFPLLRYGPPLLGLALTLLLRFGWALAPTLAATEGPGPRAALRRSWKLTWSRPTTWLRALAVTLPLGGLTVGLYLLLWTAARPVRAGTASLFLEWGPDNTYAAYVAGVLAPIAVALLLTGALVLPLAHVALAALHRRLTRAERPPDASTTVRTATAPRG
ncbi:hypothetical protein [Streptomyces sp. bgisy091]|uniref:hypothetical protein n=1 Tax=Streptomyces sp. bgisy091 TaxID=3413778 RepID=UPI003D73ECD0